MISLITLGLCGTAYCAGVITGVYLSERDILTSTDLEKAGRAAKDGALSMMEKLKKHNTEKV